MANQTERLSYAVFLTDILFQPENRNGSRVGSIIVVPRLNCSKEEFDNTVLVMLRVSEMVS